MNSREHSSHGGSSHGETLDALPMTTNGIVENDEKTKLMKKSYSLKQMRSNVSGKQVVGMVMAMTLLVLLWDATMTPPEQRILKPDASDRFLAWVQDNPYMGLGAFLIVIACCVVLMIPVGTVLVVGCGYVYKGAYGWIVGITVATFVSMLGSALGAVGCFLLGRYLMRERVRKWSRNYPLFDAIDIAVSEKGFRIMAMLYLTPVLPLGPVSYMCGTTSMKLSSFAFAKVASTPLMLLYVFIGASTGTLMADPAQGKITATQEANQLESNKTMIISGILLSTVTIGVTSHFIKKELYKIFEKQKQHEKEDSLDVAPLHGATEESVELGALSGAKLARHRRHTAY